MIFAEANRNVHDESFIMIWGILKSKDFFMHIKWRPVDNKLHMARTLFMVLFKNNVLFTRYGTSFSASYEFIHLVIVYQSEWLPVVYWVLKTIIAYICDQLIHREYAGLLQTWQRVDMQSQFCLFFNKAVAVREFKRHVHACFRFFCCTMWHVIAAVTKLVHSHRS